MTGFCHRLEGKEEEKNLIEQRIIKIKKYIKQKIPKYITNISK